MLKLIIFLFVFVLALQNTLNAQTIQNTTWKSYFAEPINDTATLTIGNDSITISNSHGMTVVMSTAHISNDTVTINDVDGPIKCSPADTGIYSYKVSEGKLILHIINDPCDGRANTISDKEWMMVKKK